MKSFLFVLITALLLSGFRMVSPEEAARRVIQQNEENFAVQEHAELYRYVRMTTKGEIFEGEMLIIFRYNNDFVSGVFRLLPDEDRDGVTLISHQIVGEPPKLSHYDGNTEQGGEVSPDEARRKLGDTDWFFEGIFDDDKNPWVYAKTGRTTHRGEVADIIEARYTDPTLRRAVGYDHRKLIVRANDGVPLSSEFYDHQGNLLYVIDLLSRDVFEFHGREHVRTKQLQLTDFQAGSTTVLVRMRSNWEPQLPNYIFDLEFADDWDEETDRMITARLHRQNTASAK